MAIDRLFGIAGSALTAQMTRLNLTASNIANAETLAGNETEAYRAKRPVFKALLDREAAAQAPETMGGVKVQRTVDDRTPVPRRYEPGNPLADPSGYVYAANVNEVTEMVEMMAAARSYQNNVEVVNTARTLALRTIDIAKS